jgi:predicted AlkP superfamily phosphohydrolase/phosphomutase
MSPARPRRAPPVIAIGLDSGDLDLCTRWMEAGLMPNLARLVARGAVVPLQGAASNVAETSWTNFATGAFPHDTGYWAQLRLDPGSYHVTDRGSYRYGEYPLFYALGPGFKIAAIDIPQTQLSDDIDGIQLLAWGAHTSYASQSSRPPELFARLTERYGSHPMFNRDQARLWLKGSMTRLTEGLCVGAGRRAAMTADLIAEGDYDLVIVVFSELHSGGHYLLHLGSPEHPLHRTFARLFDGPDPLARIAAAVDEGIGRIVAAAPEDANIVVFSPEGMVPNNADVPSMLFLPELLYRWSFPGKAAMRGARHGDNRPPGPPITHPFSMGWARKVWTMKDDPNVLRSALRQMLPVEFGHLMERVLGAPEGIGSIHVHEPWYQPPLWYSPHWPKMRAFALPSYSDGYIRINLAGREPQGVVDPAALEAVCDELEAELMAIRDARTGEPAVRQVLRNTAAASDPKRNDSDLVVKWADEPSDCVVTGSFGRIGPVPFSRSGGHVARGFAVMAGPGIDAAGGAVAAGDLIDLAPSILGLMQAPVPGRLRGRSLLKRAPAPVVAA